MNSRGRLIALSQVSIRLRTPTWRATATLVGSGVLTPLGRLSLLGTRYVPITCRFADARTAISNMGDPKGGTRVSHFKESSYTDINHFPERVLRHVKHDAGHEDSPRHTPTCQE